jgi:hypothetical protein
VDGHAEDVEPLGPAVVRSLRALTALLLVAGLVAAVLVDGATGRDPGRRIRTAAAAASGPATRLRWATRSVIRTGSFTSTSVGEAEVDGPHRRARFTTVIDGADRFQLVADGDRVLVELPMARWSEFGGRTWAPVDAAGLAKVTAARSGKDGAVRPDYTSLRHARDARDVGRERVRGVLTTHFHTLVDRRAAFRHAMDGAPDAEVDRALAPLARVPLDVWLDDQDRVRRIREDVAVTYPKSMGGTEIHIRTTTEAYDFGAPITIDVPPDDAVADHPVDLRTLFDTPASGGH